MKKRMVLLIAMVVYLGGCWFIGQHTHKDRESADDEPSWNSVMFEGNEETKDNPWNMTVGWFEMEDEGQCILFNPNTDAMLEADNLEEIAFFYEIHPWIREYSDGASLVLQLTDAQEAVLDEVILEVDSAKEWQEFHLDLKQYVGVAELKISCNSGANGDASGDWVVLKPIQ